MNRVSHYQNSHGQWCTEVWLDGLYSRLPDYLNRDQAFVRVRASRLMFNFKD